MRRAMAEAEVGDDVLDGDPTTRRLEQRVAELLGKEAALFFPSGIQANQTGVWLHVERGTEVILEAGAHLLNYESAAIAGLSGAQVRPVTAPDGVLTAELVAQAWRPVSAHEPRICAVAAENTHNSAGGRVTPVDVWDELTGLVADRGVPLHLDGARLWNAAAAQGVPPARLADGATTVMVCLSKGLGCPVGSCLAGPADLMERAVTIRCRLGGGMRQSGVLAAAGLYALEHNLSRLEEDHANAQLLAERLQGHEAVRPLEPDTNIVMLDLVGATAEGALARIADAGVLLVPFGPTRLRAVTHLDASRDSWTPESVAESAARCLIVASISDRKAAMHIVVVGAGEVGYHVAERLSNQQHDVVVVDTELQRLEYVANHIDVAVVEGSGTSPAVLEQAGIRKAGLLIAVTNIDEVNLVSCMSARGTLDMTKVSVSWRSRRCGCSARRPPPTSRCSRAARFRCLGSTWRRALQSRGAD
jgi:threonine aldolase